MVVKHALIKTPFFYVSSTEFVHLDIQLRKVYSCPSAGHNTTLRDVVDILDRTPNTFTGTEPR